MFRQQGVRLGEDGVQIKPFTCCDLLLTTSEGQQKAPFMFGPLVGLDAQQHRCGSASLGDDDGLPRNPGLLEKGSRLLTKVSDGNEGQ